MLGSRHELAYTIDYKWSRKIWALGIKNLIVRKEKNIYDIILVQKSPQETIKNTMKNILSSWVFTEIFATA